MSDSTTAFVGGVPEKYDRYMVPIFFDGYAEDLVARLPARSGLRVLELACGTGSVTRRLRGLRVLATDLNQSMLDRAAAKLDGVEFRQADATRLPFDDASFDAVLCQFGVMFFPDKMAAFREAHRVLTPGGMFLFNVWDALDRNELTKVAADAIAGCFPNEPTDFYDTPFGFHDGDEIGRLLAAAGFRDAQIETVAKPTGETTAGDAAVAH
ncbi:MAG TPA: methyltransferase domain-containing protein, partial [Thermoanaerobaculia bacterium]|nr:methyltransferase domain-containing protein [Thermoanaerobaculia bacterium]